ncbi:MAG: sensor histidine kinase, partial [bacterium]
MEREKIGYVIIAFSVLLGGGILDFTSSLEWHGLHYTGNISAAVYAFIIFTAVFRHRLFNTGFIFRNFIIYSLFAAVMTAIIIAAAELLLHKIPAFYGIVFIIFITILLYMKKIYLLMQKISLKIGMLTDSEKINAEMIKIKDAEETADTKLRKTAVLLSTGFEMEIFIFVIDGDHYVKWWCTEEKMCPDRVNFQEITAKTVIRYETKKIKDLDAFNADILIPLTQSMTVHGLLAGKKYTADISFLEEEIRVLENGAKIIAELLGSHILHQKKTEEESIKRMGRVAGQMAHEINNPLTALWGAAQLLDGKTGREKENIDIIREEIKRLKKILEQWRVFSDKIFIEKSRVNVNRILKDTVKMVMFDSIWENIELFIDEKDEIEAEIDSDKMRQVFINVLKNSADAAVVSGAGKIEITVEKKDMNAVIKFKDNGGGVEKGIAQRIKQPFFTTKQKGSGLGLAISERIIKGHKGAITISSDSRSYTEVVITLPLPK